MLDFVLLSFTIALAPMAVEIVRRLLPLLELWIVSCGGGQATGAGDRGVHAPERSTINESRFDGSQDFAIIT